MAMDTNSTNLDGAEIFTACLAQATLIIKQVLPGHHVNPTPDAEWDVRDLTTHMLHVLQGVPQVLADAGIEAKEEIMDEDTVEEEAVDLSSQWQQAADKAEALLEEIDLEDTIIRNGEQTAIENYLVEVAGDLLIHAWDLGEAIGMPVRFDPTVAGAVMETTVIPNSTMLNSHALAAEPIDPPANADLQTRLLALFGRSHAWRSAI